MYLISSLLDGIHKIDLHELQLSGREPVSPFPLFVGNKQES